jgi:hypothetical protein
MAILDECHQMTRYLFACQSELFEHNKAAIEQSWWERAQWRERQEHIEAHYSDTGQHG